MLKNEFFLSKIIGIVDEDDVEEITSAVLRYRNIERSKKLKNKQSQQQQQQQQQRSSMSSIRGSSAGDGKKKEVSFVNTSSSATTNTTTTTTTESVKCDELSQAMSTLELFNDVDSDELPTSLPQLTKSKTTLSKPNTRPSSDSFNSPLDLSTTTRMTSPPSSSSTTTTRPKKSRSASLANFKYSFSSSSTPDFGLTKENSKMMIEEDDQDVNQDVVSDLLTPSTTDATDDFYEDITSTSMASLRISEHNSPVPDRYGTPPLSPTGSPFKSPKGGHEKRNLLSLSWGNSQTQQLKNIPKDASETDAIAKSILDELNLSIETRSELECIDALTRLHQYVTDDMVYYQDALGREGACKAISVVLSLFSASTRICLETVQAISLLCQYDDTRESYHAENAECLGGHGTCFSVIRILSSSTHVSNAELVKETCRAIGKLGLCDNNNKVMTNGGCCESLLSLIQQQGQEEDDEEGHGRDNHDVDENRHLITIQAMIAIRYISERKETMQHMLNLNVCEIVVKALSEHQGDEATCLEILNTIIALATTSRLVCARLGEAGASMAVMESVRYDDVRATVFEKALVAVEVLLAMEANLPKLLQANICNTLVESLQRHSTVDNVAINACRVIQLFANNAIIRSKLSSAGVCEVMRTLFSTHMATPSVIQACCAAVATLAAAHNENKSQLTAAGVCEFVIMAIQKYSVGEAKLMGNVLPPGSDLVVWQANWALRMLAAGVEENRTRLQSAHVCEALNAALQRHTSSVEPMIQVFRTLIVLASDKNHPIVAHMGTTGICKSVVRTISKNHGDATICKLGCQVIVRLGAEEQNLPVLLSARASEIVSKAIMKHASADTQLTEWGCKALHTLCSDDINSMAKPRTSGEVEAVVWAIQRQGNFVEVAEWSARVFCLLSHNEVNAMKFGGSGGCEAIINLTKTHSRNAAVCEQACEVFHLLALNENNRAWLGASGGCSVLGTVLHHHAGNATVCTAACMAVGKLACNHEGNSARLRSIGMCEKILDILDKHVDHEKCADSTCYAVFELSKFKENVNLMSNLQVCEKVVAAMIAHKEVDAVDKHALQAIQRLSLPQYQSNFEVFSIKENLQHIVNVLSSQEVSLSSEVAVEGCKVIDHLAITGVNKQELGNAGACRALVTMLRIHHLNSELVVAHVAVSCAKLAKDCDANVERFMDQSACELFLDCLDGHKNSDDAIISVFQILHYLAFSSTTARTIILEKESIFRDVVRIIPHVKQDGRGVFWCFRLLLTLVWDTDSRDAAHRANVYKVLPVTALSLKENRHVMLASLLAIEALVAGYTSIDDCFNRMCSNETCDLISFALSNYQSDKAVALVACRLIHIFVGKEDGGVVSPQLSSPRKSTPVRRKSAWQTLKTKFFSSTREKRSSSSGLVSLSQQSDDDSSAGGKAKHYFRSRLGQGGACEHLPKLYANVQSDEEMVIALCEAMVALSLDDNNVSLIGAAGAVEVVTHAIRDYGEKNKDLFSVTCQLIASLSRNIETNANQFGQLGVCSILASALSLHHRSAEAAESGCRAVYYLASQNVSNQTALGQSGISLILKKLLQHHNLSSNVSLSGVSALYAVLRDHHHNSAEFAAVASPQVFLNMLHEFINELEVVKQVLWVLNCVRLFNTNKILVLDNDSSEDIFKRNEEVEDEEEDEMLNEDGNDVILALNMERVREIVLAIKEHYPDEGVALYGCELISSILIWGDYSSNSSVTNGSVRSELSSRDGRIYLLNKSHNLLTNFFDSCGVCELISDIMKAHDSNATVITHALHAMGLFLRPGGSVDIVTLNEQQRHLEERMKHFGNVVDCEVVLRLLHKYGPQNNTVLKYAVFVLCNVLYGCDDNQILNVIVHDNVVKSIFDNIATAEHDPGVCRYGCLFISRLQVVGEGLQSSIIAEAERLLLFSLQAHLQVPEVVEHALNGIHVLCSHSSSASDDFGNSEVFQLLATVFSEYMSTSVNNEAVAYSLTRAVTSLAEDNGVNCLKFGKVGACEDIVKLLIHYLNGHYIAIIQNTSSNQHHVGKGNTNDGEVVDGRQPYCELVAKWSCRAIGCLAKDPSTWSRVKSGAGFNENRETLGDVVRR